MIPVLSLDMEDPFGFIEKYGSFDHVKIGHSVAIFGKNIFSQFEKRHLKVIVDLKFTDIPSTVARSVKSWDHPCVVGFTVHAAAGIDAVKAAIESTDKFIFSVVKLTSIQGEIQQYIDQITALKDLGSSFVLPGRWAIELRKIITTKILVPGVRMKRQADDQKDVVSIDQIKDVADFAVIGREVYKSDDPKTAMEDIRRLCYA
ncbi:MAG TPA: orotidine-5'-phosphate decarboxylase [Pseudothermotoga sp.]|nr:orotidine-5'-phosphate decarboxylase [Pseudothermotoga sp.]HPP71046.1 orotidine-5'-phosphate decarboxylase [Pseudothermotoga sp.]